MVYFFSQPMLQRHLQHGLGKYIYGEKQTRDKKLVFLKYLLDLLNQSLRYIGNRKGYQIKSNLWSTRIHY